MPPEAQPPARNRIGWIAGGSIATVAVTLAALAAARRTTADAKQIAESLASLELPTQSLGELAAAEACILERARFALDVGIALAGRLPSAGAALPAAATVRNLRTRMTAAVAMERLPEHVRVTWTLSGSDGPAAHGERLVAARTLSAWNASGAASDEVVLDESDPWRLEATWNGGSLAALSRDPIGSVACYGPHGSIARLQVTSGGNVSGTITCDSAVTGRVDGELHGALRLRAVPQLPDDSL